MVSRRTLIGVVAPTALVSALAQASTSDINKTFRIFESVDSLSGSSGTDGEIAYLLSYHLSKSTGGGFIIFVADSVTPADMITSYPALRGMWKRISESSGFVNCSYAGMLAQDNFDNTIYHNVLINWANDNGIDILYDSGTYYHSGTVEKKQSFTCPNLVGHGSRSKGTVLKFDNDAFFKIKGGSGVSCAASISGITFSGAGNNVGLLTIADQCGLSIERCIFEHCKSGVKMVNEGHGGFTEFNVLDRCLFTLTCETGVIYERQKGKESFHGTGLRECIFQQQKFNLDAPHIYIGYNCLVYNSPMTIHIFRSETNAPIIKHDGLDCCNVYGIITVEKTPKNVIDLVLGKRLYIIGSVISLSENLATTNAIFCSRFQTNSDGSVNFIRNPASLSGSFDNASRQVVINLNAGESAFIDLTVTSSQGTNRGLMFIAVDVNGKGKITNTGMSPIASKFNNDNFVEFENSKLYVKNNGHNSAKWIADISFIASRFQFTMK